MKIGIITDIHENVEMLTEALKLADRYKCDEIICLGDIVGFDARFYRHTMKRSAKGCIELIRSNCRWASAGNHDLFAAGKNPVYSNGFEYPDNWFKMKPEERSLASNGKVWSYACDEPNDLDEASLEYLRSLPEYFIVPFKELLCIFSHYIFPDFTGSTTRYIERNCHLNEAWKFMELQEIRYSFSGHSHNNFTGFAYRNSASFFKAIHSIPDHSYNLGNEMVIIILPALAGEKGKSGFSIIDSDSMKLDFILTGNA